jgi:hypothetical protein
MCLVSNHCNCTTGSVCPPKYIVQPPAHGQQWWFLVGYLDITSHMPTEAMRMAISIPYELKVRV